MPKDFKQELVQRIARNLLDIHILRLIRIEPNWGYRLKKEMNLKFSVQLRHGVLYPLLNSLERKALLTSDKQQFRGRVRKVYTLTRKGKNLLETYETILKEQLDCADIR